MKAMMIAYQKWIIPALFLTVTACATASFSKNTYDTLATSADAYRASMQSAGELYKKGMITEAQKTRIIVYGEDFWLAYHTAVDALEAYQITKDRAGVYTALATLSAALGSFLEYAQSLNGGS